MSHKVLRVPLRTSQLASVSRPEMVPVIPLARPITPHKPCRRRRCRRRHCRCSQHKPAADILPRG